MQSSDELSSNSSSVDLSEGSSEEAVSPEINGELIATHTGGCSPSSMLWLTIMFSGISGLLWGYDIGKTFLVQCTYKQVLSQELLSSWTTPMR